MSNTKISYLHTTNADMFQDLSDKDAETVMGGNLEVIHTERMEVVLQLDNGQYVRKYYDIDGNLTQKSYYNTKEALDAHLPDGIRTF